MLSNIPGEALRDIELFLRKINEQFKVKEAYLFGSFARGDWLRTSDIDLVIVSEDFEGMGFLNRLDALNKIQWDLGLKHFIEVIPLTPQEFLERLQYSAVLRDASKYWIRII
ncbi:nucleotidyltransferase domain-containing protein [Caldivirga sp. UBA161]|uniref:nucleotidyltransferase domain-containing protein n=1 Tax=Caldivirga sp. UBA161 TaxID=1915569 RepID=UPI0025C24D75|nr:nucleotidyltransferase domain-containing protein [Caldivirga sp. UBA161]